MQTVPINLYHLRAVSIFTGNKDIRYYLNGVCVEIRPDAVRLCATDGHRLALTHTGLDWANWGGQPDVGQFIIPNDTVRQIAKVKLTGDEQLCYVKIDGDGYTITAGDLTLTFTPIDGKFPDWQLAIPQEYSGKPAQFNPDYLADFARAARVYDKRRDPVVTVAYNGQSAALIGGVDHEFLGLLMPYRANTPELPDWYAPKPALAEAA